MNQWDKRFNKEKYVYGTEPNAFLQQAAGKIDIGGEGLAIAEGEGRNAVYLAGLGLNMTAWDYAESGLWKTENLAADRSVNVKTQLVDLTEAEWEPDQWDLIVNIFGHFPEEVRRRTLQGVKQSIKPGGYFVTEVYSPYQIPYKTGGPPDKALLYKPEEFLELFSDWHIIHFFMGEAVRHEGEGHTGLAHVIQFIGRKP